MGSIIISSVVFLWFISLKNIVQGVENVKGYPPSINCAKEDCVSYEVVHSQKEFEIRIYNKSIWIASGNVTTVSYGVGYSAAYLDAYVYYRGENEERFAWDKNTQPVITEIIPKTSYDSIYRVYIYVPNDYQNKTLPHPYPTADVTAVTLPRKKFAAVRRFDGFITDRIIAAELAALKKSLAGTTWESAAAAAAPGCSVADYQFQLVNQEKNRVNEVILWFDQN